MGQRHTPCAVGDDPESTGAVRPPLAPKFSNGAAVRIGVTISAVSASTVLADFPVLLYLLLSLHRIQTAFSLSSPSSLHPLVSFTPSKLSSLAMTMVQKPLHLLSSPSTHHRRYPSAPPAVLVQPTHIPGLLSLSKPHSSTPHSQQQQQQYHNNLLLITISLKE
jgi:hypothetical protein